MSLDALECRQDVHNESIKSSWYRHAGVRVTVLSASCEAHQFTGTVRTGARSPVPVVARRMPTKVRRNRKARLLCVSVASM